MAKEMQGIYLNGHFVHKEFIYFDEFEPAWITRYKCIDGSVHSDKDKADEQDCEWIVAETARAIMQAQTQVDCEYDSSAIQSLSEKQIAAIGYAMAETSLGEKLYNVLNKMYGEE